ncbi:hypothetical protein [Clostridium saccharobutylicum]|uniref:Uncharacterized protein n=1 Tax=Clostridium saccharobutylicum TaxID=169679 RepID=A0A1S8N5H1_CLOSA|nr:hypothetical protein [Clostridium saccharobutylicum]OOM11670.1 hypothetical protein CLOSAC_20970 [Clostridium saccharobutylicum]
MIVILKKINTIISIILAIALIFVSYEIYVSNKSKVKLFENVNVENIDEISITYIGGSFSTTDKNQISEIMNYLKTLKFSKRADNNVPNTTPDAMLGLADKNGHAVIGLRFYGYVARVSPKENDDYTTPDGFYSNIEELCKKYK